MGKHGCVVCVASSRLHLTCLPAVPDRTQGLIHTSGDACRQPGRARLQQLLVFVHDQLAHGATVDHRFAQVFATQRGMVSGCSIRLPQITTAEFYSSLISSLTNGRILLANPEEP